MRRFEFQKKFLYSSVILIIIFAGIVVGYNFIAGVPESPGHTIDQFDAPEGCTSGQVLIFDQRGWKCADLSNVNCKTAGSCSKICIGTDCKTSWDWIEDEDYSVFKNINGKVGIGTTTPLAELTVNGKLKTDGGIKIGDGDESLTCSSSNSGALQYLSSVCENDGKCYSRLNLCMKTGSSSYAWRVIKENLINSLCNCNKAYCYSGSPFFYRGLESADTNCNGNVEKFWSKDSREGYKTDVQLVTHELDGYTNNCGGITSSSLCRNTRYIPVSLIPSNCNEILDLSISSVYDCTWWSESSQCTIKDPESPYHISESYYAWCK